MTELKHCPFCGGEAEYVYGDDNEQMLDMWGVSCSNAKCEVIPCTLSYHTKEEAASAWNTRHMETDALREACRELVAYAGTCPFDAKDIDSANWSEQCERECSTDVDMAACWMRYFLEVDG